jgi:S1-C subfamily serine protease
VPVGTLNATESPRFAFRGSGFAVADGRHVVTAAHVLPPADQPELLARLAVLPPGDASGARARAARVVAVDRLHDVVVLRMEGDPLPALALADPDSAREGQAIALVGFPIAGALGYLPVTHQGIVSSITVSSLPAPTSRQLDARSVARLREGSFSLLQLDAVAYPGNSGGPLVDAASGRVIGVIDMVLLKGNRESALSAPTGISYAVPVRHVLDLLVEAGLKP